MRPSIFFAHGLAVAVVLNAIAVVRVDGGVAVGLQSV